MAIVHVQPMKTASEWASEPPAQIPIPVHIWPLEQCLLTLKVMAWINRPLNVEGAQTSTVNERSEETEQTPSIISASWYDLSVGEYGVFDMDFDSNPAIEFASTARFAEGQGGETAPLDLAVELVWATPYTDSREFNGMRHALNDTTKIYLGSDSAAEFALLPVIVPDAKPPFYNPILAQLPRLGTVPPSLDSDSINDPYSLLHTITIFDLSLGFRYANMMRFSGSQALTERADDFVTIQE